MRRLALLVGDDAPNGGVYTRDTARALVFTIEPALVTDLERGADAYREKDLFSFRPFNATRLAVTRADTTTAFEKRTADDDDGNGWRRLEPDAGDVEQNAMDDLLGKLSNLRADSFVDTRDGTGLDAPLAVVDVTFGDSEEERVTIGRAGDTTHAVHGEESGAGVVDTRAVDDALEALDAVAPPS